MSMKLRKLSYAMGVEVTGVDITRPLGDEDFSAIRKALFEHCILLFRGVPLTRAQYSAFGQRFGQVRMDQPGNLPDFPEIKALVAKPKKEGKLLANFNGSDWHSDMSYTPTPIIITMLKAVQLPEVGGDTQFSNLYLAYETLSPGMKKMLEGVEAIHMEQESELDHSSPEALAASRKAKTTAHKLVVTHPETGRKLLYIGDKVRMLAGMTMEESEPLLGYLRMHAQRPQYVYRHVWQKDDIVVWDQRATNHNAIGDYDRRNELRHLDKITLRSPVPTGRPYEDPTGARNLTETFVYHFQ
jgi:taurine dioxygenase